MQGRSERTPGIVQLLSFIRTIFSSCIRHRDTAHAQRFQRMNQMSCNLRLWTSSRLPIRWCPSRSNIIYIASRSGPVCNGSVLQQHKGITVASSLLGHARHVQNNTSHSTSFSTRVRSSRLDRCNGWDYGCQRVGWKPLLGGHN